MEVPMSATPKHLWIVGVLAFLWNCMGAMNYVMTQFRVEAYMSSFTQEQLDYYYGFPAWAIAFWAVAVWFGVAGSVLLLMRRKIAETVLLISLVSMAINSVYTYGMSSGMEIQGTGGFMFSLLIFFFALGLWLYSRSMRARGVLA
jgi:hypothetical protein